MRQVRLRVCSDLWFRNVIIYDPALLLIFISSSSYLDVSEYNHDLSFRLAGSLIPVGLVLVLLLLAY